jgi:hypothetical protein
MASTYLSKTFGQAGNRKTWTWSGWVKLFKGDAQLLLFSEQTNSYPTGGIYLQGNQELRVSFATASNNWQMAVDTDAKYRDVNGWYHYVVAVDTTQSTASDRVKIYVNGVLQTELNGLGSTGGGSSTPLYPDQNYDCLINRANLTYIGGDNNYSSDCAMSHIHFIDGTAYPASTFGSTDSTTGEWKINTSPSVTYGTNGFFILKNGNSVTDQSGNSNNWTVANGTLTKTEDCPSNVFCTGNSLIKGTNGNSNGNNTSTSGQSSWESLFGTIASSSGKWYAEFKTGATGTQAGVIDIQQAQTFDIYGGSQSRGWGYDSDGIIYNNGSNTGGTYASFTAGDVIGVAMDLDNHKLYFHKNGTYQNSGDPTSGATGTGAKSITSGYDYTFFFGAYNGNMSANFGNGYFGTTAVSSAGSNASNNGIFEYDVPSGYTALSTKGLNL